MNKKKKGPAKRRNRGEKGQRQVAPKLSRVQRMKEDDIFGFMAEKTEIVGDIESPIEDWKY
ncbi:MAG: hypothetical protein WCE61_09470 [Candidatus Acidiferrum sp.]